jgi:hypothetical protein
VPPLYVRTTLTIPNDAPYTTHTLTTPNPRLSPSLKILFCNRTPRLGALAYADDLVPSAPSANVMRFILRIWDEYAAQFIAVFNAS